ncbi:MAG: hypothetical protein J0M00_03630 [Burkholderiales bacterium]|jgi:hypothetical protein|nr:hypothetical protein [Dechloromonas sp.]MBN8490505.1 hypothetical protein [Burkholderiales bacterium]
MLIHKVHGAARTLAGGMVIAAASAGAAPANTPAAAADDVPMADYLGLLAQIAPAAEDGAKAYLLAFQRRCGRHMSTPDLRRAMSDGDGDPVLMAMIRASHLRDTGALAQLGSRVACERRASQ